MAPDDRPLWRWQRRTTRWRAVRDHRGDGDVNWTHAFGWAATRFDVMDGLLDALLVDEARGKYFLFFFTHLFSFVSVGCSWFVLLG